MLSRLLYYKTCYAYCHIASLILRWSGSLTATYFLIPFPERVLGCEQPGLSENRASLMQALVPYETSGAVSLEGGGVDSLTKGMVILIVSLRV